MVARKGYKLTEVGEIPEDWEVVTIGDVSDKVGSGITPTGGKKIYCLTGRPFMRSQNVGWGKLLLDDIVFISDDIHARFPETEIKLHDVLLNITGASIGRCSIADERITCGNVNQHVCIIRSNQEKMDPYFLCSFILSSAGQKQIDSFQAGGNRQGLNFAQTRSIQLATPPTLSEQTAIATALSDADVFIDALEQCIAKKRHIKQGAMQELLTGKRRLPGFEGEWKAIPFGELATPSRSRFATSTAQQANFCIELEHIGQGTGLLLGYTHTTELSSLKSCFEAGDVLFGKLRAYLRKYWRATRSGVCSTEIWVLKSDTEKVVSEYIYQVVQTDVFIETASTAYGTHMPRSDWRVVKNLEIQLPPTLDEQTAIAAVLTAMDDEIAALEAKLSKAKQIKAGMMQELLTGRIRLV